MPRLLVQNNKVVTIAADVFFVDGTAFLITVSWRIKFVMAEHLQVRTATSLCKHLGRVLQVYARAGFLVRTILMDGEFEKVKDCLPNIECNTTAAKEHVSKAKRTFQTIKEQARGIIVTMPFADIPRRMKIKFYILSSYGLTHSQSRPGYHHVSPQESFLRNGNWITRSTVTCSQDHIARFMTSRHHPTLWSHECTRPSHWSPPATCRGA
jgi:hypothetical protein